MSEELIEVMARAMADELKENGAFVSDDLRKCQIDGGLLDMHDIVKSALAAIADADMVIVKSERLDALEHAVRVCSQTMLEVGGAQLRGAGWYTKGASGLYQQVDMHVRRANDAIRAVGIDIPAEINQNTD